MFTESMALEGVKYRYSQMTSEYWFSDRLFDIIQDIFSGLMFTQLLSNVVLFGSSLYQFEKVRCACAHS